MGTNEQRVRVEQLRRQRWNWLGVLLLGIVLLVLGGSSDNGALSAVGIVLGILGAVMRGKATKDLQLLCARQVDQAG